jgi:hypothetical protein
MRIISQSQSSMWRSNRDPYIRREKKWFAIQVVAIRMAKPSLWSKRMVQPRSMFKHLLINYLYKKYFTWCNHISISGDQISTSSARVLFFFFWGNQEPAGKLWIFERSPAQISSEFKNLKLCQQCNHVGNIFTY